MMPLLHEAPPMPPPPVEEIEVSDAEQPDDERLPAVPEIEPVEELN